MGEGVIVTDACHALLVWFLVLRQATLREKRLRELQVLSDMVESERMRWKYISSDPEHQSELVEKWIGIWENAIEDIKQGTFLDNMPLQ